MPRDRKRDTLRSSEIDRSIDRAKRGREQRMPAEAAPKDNTLQSESLLYKLQAGAGKLKAGAESVAGKAGPVIRKVQTHAQSVNRNMERSGGGMGGGMGMDFSFTPFGGGLPSAPGFGGMGPAPRAPRRSTGGSSKGVQVHVHVGGSGAKTTRKKKRSRGGRGGGGSVPPWDPNFRLPY